jgi:hypothetical protein
VRIVAPFVVMFLLLAIALGPSIVCYWLTRLARRAGRHRTAVIAGTAAVALVFLMPLWVAGNVHAWWQYHISALKLPYEETRSIYVRAWNRTEDDPDAPWPPRRAADAPEPTVDGKPLTYLPAASLREIRTARPDAWLAYSARIMRRFWYAPWFDIDVRAVLHADGSVQMLDEDYFQSLLASATDRAPASHTTDTKAKEGRDPHVVGPD